MVLCRTCINSYRVALYFLPIPDKIPAQKNIIPRGLSRCSYKHDSRKLDLLKRGLFSTAESLGLAAFGVPALAESQWDRTCDHDTGRVCRLPRRHKGDGLLSISGFGV